MIPKSHTLSDNRTLVTNPSLILFGIIHTITAFGNQQSGPTSSDDEAPCAQMCSPEFLGFSPMSRRGWDFRLTRPHSAKPYLSLRLGQFPQALLKTELTTVTLLHREPTLFGGLKSIPGTAQQANQYSHRVEFSPTRIFVRNEFTQQT